MANMIYTDDAQQYAYESLKDLVVKLPKTKNEAPTMYWDNEIRAAKLVEILSYNRHYRDKMKHTPADLFTHSLIAETPILKAGTIPALLKGAVTECKKDMGDYTIERLPKDTTIVINRKTYKGIETIKKRASVDDIIKTIVQPFSPSVSLEGTRYHRNFWFCGDNPTKWNVILSLKKSANGRRLTEKLPKEVLPMIYYDDGSNTMLVAYDENENQISNKI